MQQVIDLKFPVFGRTIPIDHGYALYAAICSIIDSFHNEKNVGLGLLRGKYMGEGILNIAPRSELRLRMPADLVFKHLLLAGKTLDVSGRRIRIGTPNASAIQPCKKLYAHIVTTKNGQDENRFKTEIAHQMELLEIDGSIMVGKRKTFSIHHKQVVGYVLHVRDMRPEDSIKLQIHGLGGRRKIGCGLFIPNLP